MATLSASAASLSTLTLSLPRTHFYQGEEIPATITFPDPADKAFFAGMGNCERGRFRGVTFQAKDERKVFAPDPIGWYPPEVMFLGDGADYTDGGERSVTVFVNACVRFDHPGVYILNAAASRKAKGGWPPGTWPADPDELVSNRVPITIEALTSQKENQLIGHARYVLSQNGPKWNYFEAESPTDVAELTKLAYIRTPAVLDFLVPYLEEGNNDGGRAAALAFIGAPDDQAIASLMEGAKHGKPLLNKFIVDLYDSIRTRAISNGVPVGMTLYSDGKPLGTDFSRAVQAASYEITQAAITASDDKGPIAASAYWARFQEHPQDPGARASLARHQLDLTNLERNDLIRAWSTEISTTTQDSNILEEEKQFREGGLDLLPALKMAVETDRNPYALEILCKVAPTEARSEVIADIKRPKSLFINKARVVFGTPVGLDALPEQSIPELTPTFRSRLMDPDMDPQMLLPLVDRYGSRDLLPDVIKFYEPQLGKWPCFTEDACLRFWIKYDPAAGLSALEKSLQSREGTRCYVAMLKDVFKDRWNAQAQPLLITTLKDPDPEVVMAALETLIAYGNDSAIKPSVDALDRIDHAPVPIIPNAMTIQGQRYNEATLAKAMLASKRWAYNPEQRATLSKIVHSAG